MSSTAVYDNKKNPIEGHAALTFSDDVAPRFIGYGRNVTPVGDANDPEMLDRAFDRSTLIFVYTRMRE